MSILPTEFQFVVVQTWPFWFWPAFVIVILTGLQILSVLVPLLFSGSNKIPRRGKHLDELEATDLKYIWINKFATALFVFHFFKYTTTAPNIKWGRDEMTIGNTLGAYIAFYFFYDFFYMWFHRILHLRSVYEHIHKHHHRYIAETSFFFTYLIIIVLCFWRQKVPTRGNIDAINVHPFEFITGEYLHLVTVLTIPCHIYTAMFFIIIGGILASLNHTRFDVSIPYIYDVKVHDVHHSQSPESNYGQYTMFWDRVFSTFKPYSSLNKTAWFRILNIIYLEIMFAAMLL